MFKFDISKILDDMGEKSSRKSIMKEDNLDIGVLIYPTGQSTPDHKHSNIDEIFYTIAGQGSISINGQAHHFKKGEIIFSPHDEVHGFINTGLDDWIVLQIKLNI